MESGLKMTEDLRSVAPTPEEEDPQVILLVEDDLGLAELMRGVVEELGFPCICLTSGHAALEWMRAHRPLLALLDYSLPDMTCLALVHTALENSPEHMPPFLVTTGMGDERLAVEMMKMGAQDYLVKDTSFLEHLPKALRQALDRVAQDTKLERAETALRQSEERLRQIIDLVPHMIYARDHEGRYLLVNEATARALGTDVAHLTGASLQEHGSRAQGDMLHEDRSFLSQGDAAVVSEELFCDASGENHVLQTHKVPFRSSGNGFPVVLSVSVDITPQKRVEERLRTTMEGVIRTLSGVLEKRDPYTVGHQERVAELAVAVASQMGLAPDRVEGIRIASLLHDIGKIGIPAEILSKPGHLTKNEYTLVQDHPRIGWEILKNIDFSWPVADFVLQHHERMDGSGYPGGLRGSTILIEARIIAVADVVEAMTSHRPYRASLGATRALQEVLQHRSTLYDSSVVDAFLEVFEQGFSGLEEPLAK